MRGCHCLILKSLPFRAGKKAEAAYPTPSSPWYGFAVTEIRTIQSQLPASSSFKIHGRRADNLLLCICQ